MHYLCTSLCTNNMNKFKISVVLLLLATPMLLLAEPVQYKKPDLVWNKRASSRTGRYVTKSSAIAQAFTLSVDALYYYGDMDNEGAAFKNGFNTGSLGFMANLNYIQPLGSSGVNIRYTLGGGMLRGDGMKGTAGKEETLRERKMSSIMARAAVGVEWYPWVNYGFYIYGGVSAAYSHVTFDFKNSSVNLKGKTADVIGIMLPLEVGYNWQLSKSWLLGVHIGWASCVVDRDKLNLDGYPNEQYKLGIGGGNKTPDGWYQVGLTIGYSWHNCETCRVYKW